ncbi:MAG: major capsid protein [Henriciella sp.]|nr:major capsid protein [Henriciella sp.]
MPFNFAYTAYGLTQAINNVPNTYGLLGDMNVSPGRGIPETYVRIDVQGSVVKVLPATPRGGQAAKHQRLSDEAKLIEIPHFPLEDLLTPADVQNLERVQNGQLVGMTVEDALNQRLEETRLPHDQTLEYLRVGALKGLVLDGAGETLLDLYQTFDLTQKVFDLDLENANADFISNCSHIFNHVTENLLGETMTSVQVVCDSTAFNRLVGHPLVKEYWLNHTAAAALANMTREKRGGMYGRTFEFQNLTFVEYFGNVVLADGSTSEKLIEENVGYAFPAGMRSGWETFFAPAHDMREVNTIGQELYVSPEVLKHGEGIELKTQSNPISVLKKIGATAQIAM